MRSLGVAVALLFSFIPGLALAQDLPVPLPPFVVPVPVVVPVPFPLPVPAPGSLPGAPSPPAPVPVFQPASPPPPEAWHYNEPAPPPPSKKVSGGVVALDFGAAFPIQSPDAKKVGYGGDLRGGYRFALGPVVWMSPEVTVGIVNFPGFDGALRAGLGGHVGLDAGIVEPSVYVFGGGFTNLWKQGPGVRAGAALDFRAGRYAIPGLHVDYDVASWDTGSLRYASAGVHLGFLVGR